jgi:hypothetical protein
MKLLLFSDIHNDFVRLGELLSIEADYYVAAGDTVTWERGYEDAGQVLRSGASRYSCCPEITNPPRTWLPCATSLDCDIFTSSLSRSRASM